MKNKSILILCMALILSLTMIAGCGKQEKAATPEPSQQKRDVVAAQGVVAAAHPLAAQAGLEILKKGGNAIDAAIATSFALGVVEPNASGLGGGGFAIVYVAKEKKSYVVDYRETAPLAAKLSSYKLDEKGKPIDDAMGLVTGYQSVAVPGQLRGMEMLHQKFGSMKWAELMEPAIAQSEAGLKVSENFSGIITEELGRISKNSPSYPWFKQTYYKEGLPAMPGDVVKNTELTASLKKIAQGGADVFYKGEIGDLIVKEYAEKGNGWLTKEDLANYKAVMREPVQGTYRGYTVMTVPPPSSGGVALLEILNILEGYDLAKMGAGSADAMHVITEAQKLAFADRAKYMADPAFTRVPLVGLMDKKYAEERRKLIDTKQVNNQIKAGEPGKYESGSTTSFSVTDKEGNMVTITQTINHFMGSAVVPAGTGIILNDEMDDFTINPKSVNAPEPGKRPLSSMAPTIVLKDGAPFVTVGTPGATRIITTISNLIINLIDFKMDLQPAIVYPRFHNTNSPTTSIEGRIPQDVVKALEGRGHKFELKQDLDLFFGGAQGVLFAPDGKLHGGADPRRDGVAVGY